MVLEAMRCIVNLLKHPRSRFYYYFHWTGGETEAQSDWEPHSSWLCWSFTPEPESWNLTGEASFVLV